MNQEILSPLVQEYINSHLQADVNKIALAKSIFNSITSAELVGQITAKKKAIHKLPTWFKSPNIYYPSLLSIEQTSSETTARYKANLSLGGKLIDLTAGFGVDSLFFSLQNKEVVSCEINQELSQISAYNAQILDVENIKFKAEDGLIYLSNTSEQFDTIYLDPARRSGSAKVFKLKDCNPDVVSNLPLLLKKGKRIIIKTAPLLDLSAGLEELQHVSEIHIVSVKNECKELLWIIDKEYLGAPKVICTTLNQEQKQFTFSRSEMPTTTEFDSNLTDGYLYEPDVALLKSGAFNLIGIHYRLKKLHQHTQLYSADTVESEFPGRIFQIDAILQLNELKKMNHLVGNVIVRNFPERAENLVKKYKIKPSHDDFIIFTQTTSGYIAIKAKIIQHY
jgi:16S rRNA G966 N2-methylase RsmD